MKGRFKNLPFSIRGMMNFAGIHLEFKSKPDKAHLLFAEFIKHSIFSKTE
jgi:CTP synthase (UTP-ammonia lyase)